MTKLWGGRFEGGPADAAWKLGVSTSFDRYLLADDCIVLAHHASRLRDAGMLTDDEVTQAHAALHAIGELDPDAVITDADEDVHSAVERLLLAQHPGFAGKLRAGLSRNDRVASAFRRFAHRHARARATDLLELITTLTERATEHAHDPMPGYTHLQPAQPVTIGHHLLAHAWTFTRDVERIADALDRNTADPLGAGALAGSTLPLPAMPHPAQNSIDAVSARDHILELLAAFAITGVHLSRLAEELVLWSSSGVVSFDDAFATGSSLMPQKKNPDVAELARGKAGRLIGDLTSLLVTVKGLPLAYNRDLQEDKEPFLDADATLGLVVPAMRGAIATLTFDAARCRAAAEDPMLFATDLADALVASGVAFRDAHDLVGGAVRRALDSVADANDRDALRDQFLSDAALRSALGDDTLRACFDLETSLSKRAAPGPGGVDAQLTQIAEQVSALTARIR